MDRPFREIHELYKILFERAEAQKKADEERKKQEEQERIAEEKSKGKYPKINRMPLPDVKQTHPNNNIPSPLEAEVFEEMIEEMAEGGMM